MMWALPVVTIGSGLLAVFCISQMQFFSLIFDHYFIFVVPGMITAAGSLAMAVFDRRNKKPLSSNNQGDAVPWLALAPLMASSSLIIPFSLPLGSIAVFLLIALLLIPPFFCWIYGVKILSGKGRKAGRTISVALISGLVMGFIVSPWMLGYAGGPLRLGWMIVATLSLGVLLLSRKNSLLFAGTVFLVVSGLALTQLNESRDILPHWAKGYKTQLKPVLGEMAPGKSMKGVATYWDASVRTDLAIIKDDKNLELGWVLTNGTSPVPMLASGKEKPLSWWQEQFPIISIPFEIGNPGAMLTVGAVAGPEVHIAKKIYRGDIHAALFNHSLDRLLQQSPWRSLGAQLEQANDMRLGNPRNILKADDSRYAMIFLPITQPGWYGWFGSSSVEGYHYTIEAMQEYLRLLEKDGMLVITTREEVLFVRSLLTAWNVLEREHGRNLQIERHAIGVRLASGAPNRGSYKNLLIIFKDEIPEDVRSRLHEVADNSNVEILFGAGNKLIRPYKVLSHEGGLKTVKKVMQRIYSRHYKVISDLEPTTDIRPVFFQVLHEFHPFLKWLLTLSLAVLIGCILLPLPSLRRIDNADSAGNPPIPVLLGYFLLSSLALTMIVAAQQQFSFLWPVHALHGISVLLAILVTGLGTGLLVADYMFRHGKGGWLQWVPLILVIPVFLAGCLMTLTVALAAALTGWQQAFFMILIPALTGFVAGSQLLYGMRKLGENLDNLIIWAWIVIGAAALAGTMLAYWIAQFWGWNLILMLAACGFLLPIGIGFWAWSPSRANRGQTTA